LRRGAEQQDPRDPASRLWLARRGLSTAQNTDLHAARLVAELSSATSTSFVTFTVDLLARHSLIYKLAALERCGHDGQRKRLPTCPQQQKQPQPADRNGPKLPTRLHDEPKMIKSAVKKILEAAGYELWRININHKFEPKREDRFKWIRNLNIRTVLDVGANTGQFADEIH